MYSTFLINKSLHLGMSFAKSISFKPGSNACHYMNILIQIKDSSTDREIREFTEGISDHVFISHSTEESISIISNIDIQKAVVSLKSLKDAAILKYINDYYTNIEVVVLANKTYDDIISIFQKSNYSVIHEPLQLSELKQYLHKKQKVNQKIDK